jgi:predicted nucleic acid-binding protein
VLVAAYNWLGGMADRAYLLVRTGVVDLHVSEFVLGEVRRVLREKFGWEGDRVERAMAQVRRGAAVVRGPAESPSVVEDGQTDDRILECALAAGAGFVVAWDKKHLLSLGSFRGISIVALRDFLAAFSEG